METLWLSTLEISDLFQVGPVNGHLFTLPKIVEVTRSKHISMSNITGEPTSFAKATGEAVALSMYLNSEYQALVFQYFVDICL